MSNYDSADHDDGPWFDWGGGDWHRTPPPVVPDYCQCGQHVDEHAAEMHNMRMDRLAETSHDPDRFCDHGTPADSLCGRCAALGEMTTGSRLFATAAELGVPPVPFQDGDLSRIRVLDRDSPEGQEELRKRAERKAKRERIEGIATLTGLRAL